jgi:thiol-disulfide isomerase/thioredoxin
VIRSEESKSRWQFKVPRNTLWLMPGIFLLVLLWFVLGAWHQSQPLANEPAPGPNEITGTSKEAVASLKKLIDSDAQTFVYFYEPNCKLCSKMEPIISAEAAKKGVTMHRFNISKYKEALKLKNAKNVRLVSFYKELPAVAYYNKDWLIAWGEGDQPAKTYDEFYDHFRFGDDDHSHADQPK